MSTVPAPPPVGEESGQSAQRRLEELLERQRTTTSWGPLARAITVVENAAPWELAVPPPDRPAHVIGVTGPPGAGKSTLVGQLIGSFGRAGARVGVLAIDPSSPIHGGAVLGDRVRMEGALEHRPDVFVRSMASRGSSGAVAAGTANAARVLEATGLFDVIVIETVGAGQTEVAVAGLADTVLLVTVPGLGDAVQAIKGGVMELADMVVVNMADRPGAGESVRHLRLALGHDMVIKQTVATQGEGIDELRLELEGRWERLLDGPGLDELRARKRAAEATLVAVDWLRQRGANVADSAPDGLKVAVKKLLKEAADQWPE
jgi:LAO/AO transport system kinase